MNRVEQAIGRLVRARRSGMAQPVVELADAQAAYAVQEGVAAALGWFPGGLKQAWKSGGAAPGPDQTHAPLPPAGVWRSPAQAGDQPWHWRGIEAEIALRLREPVDAARAASVDADTAARLVDALCVAIEIVDSRWLPAMAAPVWDKLADIQSHGALVLGAWRRFEARDWSAQPCRVEIGGQPARDFRGSHSMGDPTRVLPSWLKHGTRQGAILAAGTVVTTGTWCGLLQARAGDTVRVDFPGIGEASVEF